MRIAIVEDSGLVADVLREVLMREPDVMVVGVARSAAQGRILLPQVRPDVAVVDWKLGDGDGIELITELDTQLPRTRWLLASDWGDAEMIARAERAAVHGVLDKRPGSWSELRTAVRAVAAGREHWCPASAELRARLRREPARYHLTPREHAVLERLARHESRTAVAAALGIDAKAVWRVVLSIARKLELAERATLAEIVPAARAARWLPRVP